MPPKSSARGGRGRGRGGAMAAPPGLSHDTNTRMPPNGNLDDASQPMVSPNSSPVSAPTETPATTPARMPAPPSRPSSAAGRGGGVAGRGPRGQGGAGAAPARRFQPRAVRRAVDEREEAARKEAERVALREKDAAALERLNSRGRGRGRGRGDRGGGRGRGDAMGMGGRGGRSGASGPFGQAPEVSGKRAGLFAPGGGSGGGGGFGGTGGSRSGGGGGGASGSRIKSEGGGMGHYNSNRTAADGSLIKDEDPEPIYPEDQEEGGGQPRIDIERINLISDDENSGEEPVVRTARTKGKGTNSKSGLRPVRLAREEHKARVAIINTDSAITSLPKEETAAPEGEGGSTRAPPPSDQLPSRNASFQDENGWAGVWRDETEPRIKADPDGPSINRLQDIGDIMEIDSGTNSPAPAAGVDFKLPAETLEGEPLPGPQDTPRKPRAKRMSSTKDRKPVLQTEEDKAEYERHCQDIKSLAHELGGFQAAIHDEEATADFAEDVDMETLSRDLEGRMYLFQFPPILPPLHNPVKKEERGAEDMEMTGIAEANGDGTGNQVDLTQAGDSHEAIEIKAEPGVFVAPAATIPEAGLVGKLVVRQSGKVELDWGGTSLALEKGAVFDFLATTLVVDGPEEMSEQEAQGYGPLDGRRGNGSSMGSVMGKFVLTPDWEKLFR